ncbi:YafY family transcriptional regulator [Pseudomonas sp. LPB0260]|uniref:helix-turn-helix transcriptional regulator n=1 Tax=Pseudomonas sp. LPB0260 TaxID=2614442 RepID=UPI0015C25AA9|nr:YafY family protein [Pseudomonas sp. LPB0260]QLC74612.1 YafY family transcriptional regulator [Pseudomonas sp. LPB0260]QLC77380.1 YafY family transcriptional regulator [Pseudomonas sp. LPB0260]
MRKAERLFQLVNFIRVHQPITAAALASRLSVSVRSIYRYIDDLSLSGIPIYGEPGLGYRLQEHFELPPLNLSSAELEALLLAVAMVDASTGKQFAQAARSLQSKIEAALPCGSHAIAAKAHVIQLQQHGRPTQHWDRLWQAIEQDQAIELDYLSLPGQRSRRILHPLGLFYWGGKWTLGAWCCLRSAYRDFRLDRIEQLAAVSSAPSRPDAVNLADYLRSRSKDWHAQITTDSTLSVAAP